MSKNWKAEDTIIAKGSKAKVTASDLSGGQNWVTVVYGGQQYQGYQSEFEAKGWRKLDPAMAVVGCGCLSLVGLVVVFGAILSGLSDSPQPVERSDSPQPVEKAVKPLPSPSPVQRAVKPSPVQKVVQPSPKPLPEQSLKEKPVEPSFEPTPSPPQSPQSPQPIRASQAGNCECPYDTDRAGRTCGKRSAYSRLGGRSGAQCYQ